jgi:hypothetical protein
MMTCEYSRHHDIDAILRVNKQREREWINGDQTTRRHLSSNI